MFARSDRRRDSPAGRSKSRQLRIGIGVGIAAAAGLVLAVVGWPDQQPSSSRDFFSKPPPRSYLIEYEVVTNGVLSWEILSVNRPFGASDLTYAGAEPPGVASIPTGGTIATYDALYTADMNGARKLSGRQPGLASGDIDLTDELQEAMRRGLLSDTTRDRTVAGRTCRALLAAEPLSGPIAAFEGAGDKDELCTDAAGLVLAERWRFHGRIVLQRTARRVISPITGWPVDLPQPPSLAQATAAPANAAAATSTAHPRSFLAPPPVPRGFASSGLPIEFRLPAAQGGIQALTVVWSFVDGPRVITVEAGALLGGNVPWNLGDTVTRAVHLGWGLSATSALRADGPELRVVVEGGRWVRIRGTVALTTLTSYAGRLELLPSATP